MQEIHGRLRVTALAFEYMNRPDVRTAFNTANTRIQLAWLNLANTYFANGANAGDDFAAGNSLFFAGSPYGGGPNGQSFVAA